MSQASEQIARQYANAGLNKREFGRLYWVTVYGALGDGVTDDSAAFAAALNAINQAGGGTLWIPYSDDGYLLTNEVNLTLSAGTKIVIMGNKAKLLARLSEPVSEKGVFNLTGDVVISGDNWTGTNELYMQNVTVEGNAAVTGNRNAFNITGFAKVDLIDCKLSKMSIGGVLLTKSKNVLLLNCDMFNNMYDGARFGNVNGVNILGGNYSDNGEISPTNGYGVAFSAGDGINFSRNILIQGIKAYNNKRKCIDVHCGHNVKITGNFIKGFGNAGIYAVNESGGNDVKDVSIMDNDIEQTDFTGITYGINVGAFSTNVTATGSIQIMNNKIRNLTTAQSNAIAIACPESGVATDYINISGNLIADGCSSTSDAIYITNNTGLSIKKMNVSNNIIQCASARKAINLQNAFDVTVKGNNITVNSGTSEHGILVLDSSFANVLVEGNLILGSATFTTPITVPTQDKLILRNNYHKNTPYYDTNITGLSVDWGTAAPTTGAWRNGSIRFNSNPNPGSVVGWMCVGTGTPGTWKSFGTVAT